MRLTYRSPLLNRHPGLYLRLWGRWYRIWRVGPT